MEYPNSSMKRWNAIRFELVLPCGEIERATKGTDAGALARLRCRSPMPKRLLMFSQFIH
jgi:hypothetical protein